MYLILTLLVTLIILSPQTESLSIPVRPEDLIIIIILFYLLVKYKFKIRIDSVFKKVMIAFIFFIALNFVSLSYAIIEGYQGGIRDINTILLYIKSLFFMLGGYLIRESLGKVKNNTVIYIFCMPILVSSLLAIFQYYDIVGLRDAAYFLYDDGSYRLSRAIGAIGNPNYAAYYHGLAIILFLTYKTNSVKGFLIKSLLLIMLFVSVVITYSRTGILGLLLSCLFFLTINKMYKTLSIGLGAALIIILYYIDGLIEGTRFGIILSGDDGGTITNFGNRADLIWSSKFERFFEHPIIGSGPGKETLSTTVFDATVYDNSYLLLLVTSGVVGFIAYFSIFYRIIYFDVFKEKFNKEKYRGMLATVCLYTLLFYLTVDLIWNVKFISYFYMLIGFYMCHTFLERQAK